MATRKVYKHEHIFIVHNVIQANTSKLKQIPMTRQSRSLTTHNQRHYFTRSSLAIWYSGVKWAAYDDTGYCSQQLVATGWITSLHACKHTHKNSQMSRGSCFQIKKGGSTLWICVYYCQRMWMYYSASPKSMEPIWGETNLPPRFGEPGMVGVPLEPAPWVLWLGLSVALLLKSEVDMSSVVPLFESQGSQVASQTPFIGCFLFSVYRYRRTTWSRVWHSEYTGALSNSTALPPLYRIGQSLISAHAWLDFQLHYVNTTQGIYKPVQSII